MVGRSGCRDADLTRPRSVAEPGDGGAGAAGDGAGAFAALPERAGDDGGAGGRVLVLP